MKARDLKVRTYEYAREARGFLKDIPQSPTNREDGRQLIRSSGSIGANYLEADNALSKRDALMRIWICLKESRESEYWLRLDLGNNSRLDYQRRALIQEGAELAKIFATIAGKLQT